MRVLRHARSGRLEPRLSMWRLRVKHDAPDVLVAVEHIIIVIRRLPMRSTFGCAFERKHGFSVLSQRGCCLVGFHSRASFCASAIWAGVMRRAMRSRKVAAPSLPCAADKLNHMYALTWSCGTSKPLS
jgi:hypothetical protein